MVASKVRVPLFQPSFPAPTVASGAKVYTKSFVEVPLGAEARAANPRSVNDIVCAAIFAFREVSESIEV